MTDPTPYTTDAVAREAKHWADHAKARGMGEMNAWLDHPLIAQHYRARGLVDGQTWDAWVPARLGRPANRSFELGCGFASRSLSFFARGVSRSIEGVDVIDSSIALAEKNRQAHGAPGSFRLGDANALSLPHDSYDLVFACHSFHHFMALERVMDAVYASLTERGLFVLEEFVGPTQFQWTDVQIELVRQIMSLLPQRLRTLKWGAIKPYEGRPTVKEVVAVSPFESIRSGEIVRLFEKRFDVVVKRALGGTLQHLLYNGIVHNFALDDPEAVRYLEAVIRVEDALVDAALLPSDFMLLIGQRRT